MVFYLLEILVLIIAYFLLRNTNENEKELKEEVREVVGPSASDIIKMRSIAKQLKRNR
jgi:hypothetical protein